MRAAITQLNYDPAAHASAPADDREVILQGTYLRDILLRSYAPEDTEQEQEYVHNHGPEGYSLDENTNVNSGARPLALDGLFKHDARVQSWAKRYSLEEPVVIEGDPPLEGLNATQVRAIALMLDNRFTLVQGVRKTTSSDHATQGAVGADAYV